MSGMSNMRPAGRMSCVALMTTQMWPIWPSGDPLFDMPALNNAPWRTTACFTDMLWNKLCNVKNITHDSMTTSTEAIVTLTLDVKKYSAFGKSLCAYKMCRKWCPRASIQACTHLIIFASTSCISAFVKSLFTYKRCWKWCLRASIQAWTRLILFATTSYRSAFVKSLCTYKRCWKWCPRASIQAWTSTIP
jgi:Fe-S-cluster-containing hydrogenase component 2